MTSPSRISREDIKAALIAPEPEEVEPITIEAWRDLLDARERNARELEAKIGAEVDAINQHFDDFKPYRFGLRFWLAVGLLALISIEIWWQVYVAGATADALSWGIIVQVLSASFCLMIGWPGQSPTPYEPSAKGVK